MARGVDNRLDKPRLDDLLWAWAGQGRRCFIVWSGFWLPILERYRAMVGHQVHVDCCRIDAMVSASFRRYADLESGSSEIWLWNWEKRGLAYEIAVDERSPIAFADRDRRLVVHGGGWGLGTYREIHHDLARTPWLLDTVVHDRAEAIGGRAQDRTFMVDPDWRTWHRGPHGHIFPPFGELHDESAPAARDEHALYQVIRHSKAIVSKPGGGTLIDSLSSATPVVLLEPFGQAEDRNGALWQHLGFGIPYAKWREHGYDEEPLARLHENLLRARRRGTDYPRYCVERLQNGAWS